MNGDQPAGTARGPRSGALGAAMEAESRQWIVRCTYCGYERSVFDWGGRIYKAAGNRRWLKRCPQCRRLSWHIVYRPDKPGGARIAATPLASPGRRRMLWTLGLGAVVLIPVLFVATLFTLLGGITDAIVRPGDAFMTALQTGDYSRAYTLCTPALQQELGSAAGLATLVGTHQPARWSWSGRSIRNGIGRLDGALTYADGKRGSAHLQFQQVGEDWKIAGFQMNPS